MLSQGKDIMYLDLKSSKGGKILRKLVKHQSTDVLIDPFRPSVLERLGLGPDRLCSDNARLIYARLSGFGQNGPLAAKAGHDINYLSLSGVLSKMGEPDRPPMGPLNLLADFGGGGLMCALGILMALYERQQSGRGQVIDSSITEGTAYLSTFLWETLKHRSLFWPHEQARGSNLLDYGAPFYRCYRTKDDKFMAVGALEMKFYQTFIEAIGLDSEECNQFDIDKWNEHAAKIAEIMLQRTQQEWCEIFDQLDCCVTPVLDIEQVRQHPQHQHRSAFHAEGTPKPTPLLSRTPAKRVNDENDQSESKTVAILTELNYSPEEIEQLRKEEVID